MRRIIGWPPKSSDRRLIANNKDSNASKVVSLFGAAEGQEKLAA